MSMYEKVYLKAERVFGEVELSPESHYQVLDYIHFLIQRQMSPSTVSTVIHLLRDFLTTLSESQQADLAQIKPADIRSYLEVLNHRHLKASTINGYLTWLNGFFSHLVEEGWSPSNPVLKRYYLPYEPRLPRPMHSRDLRKFLGHLRRQKDQAIFLLMLRCGLRISEATRVHLNDIDWKLQQIRVYNGKGKVDRVVYFSKDAQRALREWLKIRRYQSPYCFVSKKHPDRPISCRQIAQRMTQLLEGCALGGKGYSCHTLRHTFASNLLNAGVPLEVLKELMGHKRVDQTLQYAKLSDRRLQASYHQAMFQIEAAQRSRRKETYESY